MDEGNLDKVVSRLEVVEAKLALMDLEAEYARSWDAADGEAWARLFTSDGVFDMAAVGHQPRAVYRGHSALRQFCEEVSATYAGLHFMHLPKIVVSGDRARSRIHFEWIGVIHPGKAHSGRRTASGYYDVDYQYSAADGWRIAHRFEKAVDGRIEESFDIYRSADIG